MKYVVEESLDNFEAWAGGKETLDTLRKKGDCDAVECLIEELQMRDEPWSNTSINDFLWFERDYIAQYLNYSDWDEYEQDECDD